MEDLYIYLVHMKLKWQLKIYLILIENKFLSFMTMCYKCKFYVTSHDFLNRNMWGKYHAHVCKSLPGVFSHWFCLHCVDQCWGWSWRRPGLLQTVGKGGISNNYKYSFLIFDSDRIHCSFALFWDRVANLLCAPGRQVHRCIFNVENKGIRLVSCTVRSCY